MKTQSFIMRPLVAALITLIVLLAFLGTYLFAFAPSPSLSAQQSQTSSVGFFGMNTYFTGFERIGNDGDDGIETLVALGQEAGVQWGREEISWANLQQHGNYWDRNNRKIYDQRIRQLSDANYGILGMIATTPSWARVSDCQQRTEQYKDDYGIIAQEYWCPPQDMQDFAAFVQEVVERYDGDGVDDAEGSPRIAAWQLWNEPNHWETWTGTAAEYGAMLQAGYAAVKAADPTAIVVTAGLYVFDGQSSTDGTGCACHQDGLYFFDQVLKQVPDAWQSFDVLAIHPYMPFDPPDSTDILSKVTYWGRLETTRTWLNTRTKELGGELRPYWISEVGWVTCDSTAVTLSSSQKQSLERYRIPQQYRREGSADLAADAVCKTEQQQSDYMLRAHALALLLGAQHVSYHQLEDKFDTHVRDLWQATAILKTKEQNYAPKIAYGSYSILTSLLTNTMKVETGALHNYSYNPNDQYNPAAIYHIHTQTTSNVFIDMLWQSGGSQIVTFPLQTGIQEVEQITFDGKRTNLIPQNGTVQLTVGEQPVYVRQVLPPPTPTPTPTSTPTPTPTSTPTPTPTPPPGDSYEDDNACSQPQPLSPDGTIQQHTFHVISDTDWVEIEVLSDTTYMIAAEVPLQSPANVGAELYPTCEEEATLRQDQAFAPNISLPYQSNMTGTVWLKLFNHDPSVSGTHVRYDLSVYPLPKSSRSDGAIIVMALDHMTSTQKTTQTIRNAAIQFRQMLVQQGYRDEQIYALLPDMYDSPITITDVETAITTWAKEQIGDGDDLTIYIVGNGQSPSGDGDSAIMLSDDQMITPDLLNTWLTTLEARDEQINITVILEAPFAGGFVQTISKNGRIVVASSGATNAAFSDIEMPRFSNIFLETLAQGSSIGNAFRNAQRFLAVAAPWQQPLLGDRDNVANQRGLATDPYTPTLQWSPYIVQSTNQMTGEQESDIPLQATIYDDDTIARVWTEIYPPSYEPPVSHGAFITTTTSITLPLLLQNTHVQQQQRQYSNVFTNTSEIGTYRIVFFAEDNDGREAQPTESSVMVIEPTQDHVNVYLPLVIR